MSTSFAELGVPESLTRVLAKSGIDHPFEIQTATIPDALAGRDVCGRAPTGSGKTIAFGIPLITHTVSSKPRAPRALVLVPTRELAEQIANELRPLARAKKLWVMSAYGGTNINRQIQQLSKGVDVVIACPGRLHDLIDRRSLTLEDVETVVIDEADRMADMGFLPEVRKLLDLTSSQRQTLLFSATLDGDVATLTRDYQNNPVRHEVGPATPNVGSMTHFFWEVDRSDRVEQATKVIRSTGKTMVFVRTRHGVDRVTKQLRRSGVEAVAIHGARSQSQRDRSLKQFTDGEALALIATDVAARGLHIEDVACVLHFDPPEDHKAYLHRSGRTARAGASGVVVSFVDRSQHKSIKFLQKKLGLQVPLSRPDLGELNGSRSTVPMTNPRGRNRGPKNTQTQRSPKERPTNTSKSSSRQKKSANTNGKKSHSATSKHRNGQRSGAAGRSSAHNKSQGNRKRRSHSNKARSHR